MNWSLLIILILVIVIIAVIVISVIVNAYRKGKTHVKPPSQTGGGGTSDEGGGFSSNCPLDPPDFKNLILCTKDGDCSKCTGATLGYKCYKVINSGSDKDPYKYVVDGNTYNIPDGQWCLPHKVGTTKCNIYTGTPILTKIGTDGYQWTCSCNNPEEFNSPPGGDCTNELLCGHPEGFGDLVCPLDPHGVECTPGESWLSGKNAKNWNPEIGVCKCIKGYTSVIASSEPSTQCNPDPCHPGGTLTAESTGKGEWKLTCKCNSGYINCPEDVADTAVKQSCPTNFPRCLPDPCKPLGTYNKGTLGCDCSATNSKSASASNIVNSQCIEPCKILAAKGINPCGDSRSGYICQLDDDNNIECVKPTK